MLGVHNPIGADWREILVELQRLLTAAQSERWAASFFGEGTPQKIFLGFAIAQPIAALVRLS